MYKANKKDKAILLTTNDISSFVIEGDSFTILKKIKFNHYVTFAQDFAEVKQVGKINLYIYYTLMGGPAVTPNGSGGTSQSSGSAVMGSYAMVNLVVEKNGKLDKVTDTFFNEVLPEYVSDCPELSTKIRKEQLTYDDLEKIITMYNVFLNCNCMVFLL